MTSEEPMACVIMKKNKNITPSHCPSGQLQADGFVCCTQWKYDVGRATLTHVDGGKYYHTTISRNSNSKKKTNSSTNKITKTRAAIILPRTGSGSTDSKKVINNNITTSLAKTTPIQI